MNRRLSFALNLTRTYASKYPRPKPGSAERPPYRAPDPLVNNPKAAVTSLPDEDLTFIHRPPPTAPSPFSFTTNPVSPLLRPPPPKEVVALPPLFRQHDKESLPRVSDKDMARIRHLRWKNPAKYTPRVLARQFNCTPSFVTAIAALKKSLRKERVKAFVAHIEATKSEWTDRKATQKAIVAKRRQFW